MTVDGSSNKPQHSRELLRVTCHHKHLSLSGGRCSEKVVIYNFIVSVISTNWCGPVLPSAISPCVSLLQVYTVQSLLSVLRDIKLVPPQMDFAPIESLLLAGQLVFYRCDAGDLGFSFNKMPIA